MVRVNTAKNSAYRPPQEHTIGPSRGLLLIGSIVVRIGWEDDKSSVDRERFQLNAESQPLLVRKCGANFGPAFAGFAVALEFLDGEDVEVGGRLVGVGVDAFLVVGGRDSMKRICGWRGWGAE
jgi:hypothetical protein